MRKRLSDRPRRTQVYPEEAELRRVRGSVVRLGAYIRWRRGRLVSARQELSGRRWIQVTDPDSGRTGRPG
jgi:hypothetical protein